MWTIVVTIFVFIAGLAVGAALAALYLSRAFK